MHGARAFAWLVAVPLLLLAPEALRAQQPLAPAAPAAADPTTGAPASDIDVDRIERFLQTATVTHHKHTKKGITAPRRVTLSDGQFEHDAIFQSVDEFKHIMRFDTGRIELNFRDSYHFNIAAYQVARLVGMGDMVPVSIERELLGDVGSLSWWVTWKWDEQMRVKEGLRPPDGLRWRQQWDLARIFRELVYDTDRNQTNMLITEDWKLWLVDFSRAFRRQGEIRSSESLRYCSRPVLERLRALNAGVVEAAVGKHLGEPEIEALLKRRDLIVQHFDRLLAERGEERVLFD
jgi:hypothetical protein